jgi:haloalkane dehalogenase
VPFLALWGEDDPFAPVAGAQRFARERAGGGDVRVQVIPGTGHFVYDDAPETAAEALASFLAEAAPR